MPKANLFPTDHEHPFAQYVRILGKGKRGSRALTQAEAYDAMSMIMDGEVEDVQLGAFLMLMRVKEESTEELVGFVRAVKERLQPPKHLHADLDWSSYAGKRRHLPWYILSLKLLASAGTRIFIHGASGHTINRIYTEDVFSTFGWPIANNWQQVETALDSHQFCYYPMRYLCPRLQHIIDLRNTLGLRSPVHTLSRLLNPLNTTHVIQSIFHPGYQVPHQEASAELGYAHTTVIKGEAGEIEVNPDATLQILGVHKSDLTEEQWPAIFDKRHVKEPNLQVELMRDTWQGEVTHEYGQAAIISTCALALHLLGKARDRTEAMQLAQALWDDRDKTF